MRQTVLGGWAFALALVIVAANVSVGVALDTVETIDSGSMDTEYYLGYGGVGLAAVDREYSHELVLGYGLSDAFSAYAGACVDGSQDILAGETSLHVGAISTLRDGDRVDLDLMLNVAASGRAQEDVVVEQFLELNYDQDPDMLTWGLYLRSGIAVQYHSEVGPGAAESMGRRFFDLGIQPGVYFMVSDRHQLLIEYDASVAMGGQRYADEEARGVALGWNVLLTDSLELITEFHRELPPAGASPKLSFSIGLITTLPAGS